MTQSQNLMSPQNNPRWSVTALSLYGGISFAVIALLSLVWLGTIELSLLEIIGLPALAILLARNRRSRETEQAIGITFDELSEKNRMLRMTEAAAHVGHWRMSFSDDHLFWSDETFAIYGLPVGATPTLEKAIEHYHPADRAAVTNAVETARLTGKPYSFQARLVRPNGEIRHTEAIAQIETDENGLPSAMFGVLADRTEEVLLRNELIMARDDADAAGNAKSSFLAKMSHEIRTPMNGVIGFADLLLTGHLPEKQRRYAELIAESGKSLTLLLNDILDLSKIEAGEISINPQCVDLPHLARQCIRLIEPQAREKGIELELVTAPDMPRNLLVDPLRLRQILGNLLSNAVKFTEAGFVRLAIEASEGTIRCRVQDSGIGISSDGMEHIFSPFMQADSSISSKHGGTGLGLSISRQLARKMSGSVSATSTLGSGSTFTLVLPLIIAQSEEPEIATLRQLPKIDRKQSIRALLAEDYDINQMLVSAMAEQIGLNLDIAENGIEAIGMIEQAAADGQAYNVILMDLQMPEMGGIDATIALRRMGYNAVDLPIIALTANAFPEDIAACLEAGMQGHLSKPLTVQALSEEMRNWLEPSKKAA
ncbi:hypothetical protein GCM10023115_22330 [Pontixanthobacter gangjinensis]|uniref:histidine kinase n=1 Tax=Pontixanthobacter gangjinensis TaxID=1028742 RepID=A0A6I4SR07_9SPHN|nr:ATP-binding protein [Pontixanthobacter gangjinensis]MXO57476.1 response regulator [Pontixanthobacter gangjinensis]